MEIAIKTLLTTRRVAQLVKAIAGIAGSSLAIYLHSEFLSSKTFQYQMYINYKPLYSSSRILMSPVTWYIPTSWNPSLILRKQGEVVS